MECEEGVLVTYQLGVDLGTTKTAAAIGDSEQSRAVQLGNRSTAVPSVVFLRDDGTLLFGEAAQRRADNEPNRAAREFKRRVGDPVPIRLAETPYTAQQLMALMLSWVIERVTQLEGEPPATIVVTHPANWGPYKRETFLSALRNADIQIARLVPEPIAAAIHFDAERRVAPGETVAIYDLGGGTFDAAVLRRSAAEFEILGNPGGIDTLGGMEFDDVVLGQVWAAIGGPPKEADPARVATLRREVVDAKEHLSEDLSADIIVDLAEERRNVVVRRSELEELIRPLLDQTVDSLERAFTRSGVETDDVAAVVLVGGSSRIPLVQEVLKSRLGRPVVLDSQPQLAIALGAALSKTVPAEPPTEELPIVPSPSAPLPFEQLLVEPGGAVPAPPLPTEPVERMPVESVPAELSPPESVPAELSPPEPVPVAPVPVEPIPAMHGSIEQWFSEPVPPKPVERLGNPADPPTEQFSPAIGQVDPPTEQFSPSIGQVDPPTERFDPLIGRFDPSAESGMGSDTGSGRGPDMAADVGQVGSATGRPASQNRWRLPLLLIGAGVAIAALISGINAATSLPGRSGGVGGEEQGAGSTSTATTDPGFQLPIAASSDPFARPTRTASSTRTRDPSSQPTAKRTSTPVKTSPWPAYMKRPEKTTQEPEPTTEPPEPSQTEPPEETAEPSPPEPTDQPTDPEEAENP